MSRVRVGIRVGVRVGIRFRFRFRVPIDYIHFISRAQVAVASMTSAAPRGS